MIRNKTQGTNKKTKSVEMEENDVKEKRPIDKRERKWINRHLMEMVTSLFTNTFQYTNKIYLLFVSCICIMKISDYKRTKIRGGNQLNSLSNIFYKQFVIKLSVQ